MNFPAQVCRCIRQLFGATSPLFWKGEMMTPTKSPLSPGQRLNRAIRHYEKTENGPHWGGAPDKPCFDECEVKDDGMVTLRNRFRILGKYCVHDDGRVEDLPFDPDEESNQAFEAGDKFAKEWRSKVGDEVVNALLDRQASIDPDDHHDVIAVYNEVLYESVPGLKALADKHHLHKQSVVDGFEHAL
jgi:hypothetical protein